MATELLETVTRIRRELHRKPELAHEEWRTALVVESELRALGLEPWRPAPTSVAVIVGPTNRMPDIGFRADLDALPIQEENDTPYASTVASRMHACGHDGHAAALVGIAHALHREQLQRSALLVFQQAEESYPSGAPLVLSGLSSGLMPPEFFAFHLWPQLDAGVVGLREGPMLGAVAGLTVRIEGEPGRTHGTDVGCGGIDALSVGVELYRQLIAMFGSDRQLRNNRPNSLSIGKLRAGAAPNSLPLQCTLEGTLRSVSWAAQKAALGEIETVASEVAAVSGAAVRVDLLSGIRPPVVNDPVAVARVRTVCAQVGIQCLNYPDEPAAVSDDFGWFIDGIPGALVYVGCGTDINRGDLHTPTFDFDESALMVIVEAAVRLTRLA